VFLILQIFAYRPIQITKRSKQKRLVKKRSTAPGRDKPISRLRNQMVLPSLGSFKKLPFLMAVIKEAKRLSYGVSLRLARISPEADLQYRNWRIPKGTSVSMTAVLILQNPDIFPPSQEFKPEPWLDDADRRLDKDLVSFSGGSRNR
jgi:cytochrome P450